MSADHRHAAARPAWRTLDTGRLAVIGIALLILAGSLAQVGLGGLNGTADTAVVFGVLVALGELFRMVMPGNREVAPIATAAGLGYALVLEIGDAPARYSPLQVSAVVAVGMVVGSMPHLAVGRTLSPDAMARRLICVTLAAVLYRPVGMALLPRTRLTERQWLLALALMMAAWGIACFVDVLIAALIRAEAVRARFGIVLRDEIDAKAALCSATGTTATLIAVATSVMGLTALLVFTAPILVTQFAFRRYSDIRGTYLQTVRALAQVTEVGGYVEAGHSRRVSRLAVAMGRELGMGEAELLELEYAALMHDIGQLSLADPIPGGATVLASPSEQWRIAELGAGVIEQTGVLPRVAEYVRRQSDTYRAAEARAVPEPRAAAETLPPPPLASRIIKVANAYDDLVGDSADRDRAGAVLDRLRLDSAVEYDPAAVEALSRVLERGYPR